MLNYYYIYILECANSSYYIGYTTDLQRRYHEHCAGTGKCKYTRAHPPKKIAQSWYFKTTLSMILKIEYALKQISKSQKSFLIEQPQALIPFLVDSFKLKSTNISHQA